MYQQQQKQQESIHNLQVNVEKKTDGWQNVMYNQDILQRMTDRLADAYDRRHNNNNSTELHSEQSLKMQRQDDIRNQIEHDSNVIVFTGVGLTVVFITVLMLYL